MTVKKLGLSKSNDWRWRGMADEPKERVEKKCLPRRGTGEERG